MNRTLGTCTKVLQPRDCTCLFASRRPKAPLCELWRISNAIVRHLLGWLEFYSSISFASLWLRRLLAPEGCHFHKGIGRHAKTSNACWQDDLFESECRLHSYDIKHKLSDGHQLIMRASSARHACRRCSACSRVALPVLPYLHHTLNALTNNSTTKLHEILKAATVVWLSAANSKAGHAKMLHLA